MMFLTKNANYNNMLNDLKTDPILDHNQVDHWNLNKYL